MKRTQRTDHSKPVDTQPPQVCVVVVYHREPDNAMLFDCLESIKAQSYCNLECVTVDNRDNALTLGAARNLAVKDTTATLVLFVSEEDMLTADSVQAMVDLYKQAKQYTPGVTHITTGCLVLLENGTRVLSQMRAPGMFERSFLLTDPWDDVSVPDVAMNRKLLQLQQLRGTPVTFAITHHLGYIMRMHPFRRDGIQVKVK